MAKSKLEMASIIRTEQYKWGPQAGKIQAQKKFLRPMIVGMEEASGKMCRLFMAKTGTIYIKRIVKVL